MFWICEFNGLDEDVDIISCFGGEKKNRIMSRLLLPGMLLLLLSWITSSARADFNLTVLHTNDIHCRFEQINKYGSACTEDDAAANKCFGGYARLVQIIRDIRKEQPNAIFLSGGDFFQGTIWYTIYKWKVVSYFTNFLNLTASVINSPYT